MKTDEFFVIGTIARPHGLKGEVTILLDAQWSGGGFPDTFFVDQQHTMVPYFVEYSSQNGRKIYAKLEEVDSFEEASALAQKPIFLPKDLRPEPAANDFYDDEIAGYAVWDREEGHLGSVSDVLSAGPQRLLQVAGDAKEILIPVDAPFILSIDHQDKKILVALPDGFLSI